MLDSFRVCIIVFWLVSSFHVAGPPLRMPMMPPEHAVRKCDGHVRIHTLTAVL
jgi:hypothetical protein